MQARAEARYIRTSPQKIRLVVDLIRGQKAGDAINILRSTNKRIAPSVEKVLRSAIDSYTMDKQKAPQSLDDLVQEGYLKKIPQDPMTYSDTTWVTDTSDSLHSLDQTDPGVDDVHSGSTETGSDGQPYSTW